MSTRTFTPGKTYNVSMDLAGGPDTTRVSVVEVAEQTLPPRRQRIPKHMTPNYKQVEHRFSTQATPHSRKKWHSVWTWEAQPLRRDRKDLAPAQ